MLKKPMSARTQEEILNDNLAQNIFEIELNKIWSDRRKIALG